MGNRPPNINRFRERITRERKRRGWSQAEVAAMLTAMGIDGVYNTTIAKLESGEREIKLDEGAALADLFGLDLNDLRARKRDLDYLIDALSDVVFLSRTEVDRTARSLADRMEDIPADYDRYDALAGLVREVVSHLDAAGKGLDKLVEHSYEHIEQRAREQVLAERMVKQPRTGTRHEAQS